MIESNVFENIIDNLRHFSNFTEEEIVQYLSLIEVKEYAKHRPILKSGEMCDRLYFISKGLVRCFYEIPSKEVTLDILKENEYFTDYLSFYKRVKTPYTFETLEDTIIYSITYENIHNLKNNSDEFSKFCRFLIDSSYVEMLHTNNNLKIRSPKERYLYYIKNKPDICDRAPLMHIASMLNMNQSTLSRIRKDLYKDSVLSQVSQN